MANPAPTTRPPQRDPMQYFSNQHNEIPDEKKKLAYEFAFKLLNEEKCPICKADYDLQLRVPKILVQCGHTLCLKCLGQFYRSDKIRCPICLKLHKKIPAIEVMPTNHTLHKKLLAKIPRAEISPAFENLALPSDLIASIPQSKPCPSLSSDCRFLRQDKKSSSPKPSSVCARCTRTASTTSTATRTTRSAVVLARKRRTVRRRTV